MQTAIPAASKITEERSGNGQVTLHNTTLTSSSSRTGLLPRPDLATASPPMMNPALSAPHSRPQACSDINESPYASINAMNVPPRKLLTQEHPIRASNPGTPRTHRSAYRACRPCFAGTADLSLAMRAVFDANEGQMGDADC